MNPFVLFVSFFLWFSVLVQFRLRSTWSVKPVCAPSRLSEVWKQFQWCPDWQWPCLVLSRWKVDRCLFLISTAVSSRRSVMYCMFVCMYLSIHPSICAHRYCLKLLSTSDFPLVKVAIPTGQYNDLIGHFPWLQNVQDSASTGVFGDGCRTLSHAISDSQSTSFFCSMLGQSVRRTALRMVLLSLL